MTMEQALAKGAMERMGEGVADLLLQQRQTLDTLQKELDTLLESWDNGEKKPLFTEIFAQLDDAAADMETALTRLDVALQLYMLTISLQGDRFDALSSIGVRSASQEKKRQLTKEV